MIPGINPDNGCFSFCKASATYDYKPVVEAGGYVARGIGTKSFDELVWHWMMVAEVGSSPILLCGGLRDLNSSSIVTKMDDSKVPSRCWICLIFKAKQHRILIRIYGSS
jgi:hypothetical protein